jgi:hypothetical protein
MRRAGLIEAALLALAGEWRSVGAPRIRGPGSRIFRSREILR